jgi:predicted RNA-binding Zn-ribbon protein involved in translation (DUF1610 family)
VTGTIRTTCTTCGTVTVPIQASRLLLGIHADQPANLVEFTCPECGAERSERVGERATRLLCAAGITVAAPQSPSESAREGSARKLA